MKHNTLKKNSYLGCQESPSPSCKPNIQYRAQYSPLQYQLFLTSNHGQI